MTDRFALLSLVVLLGATAASRADTPATAATPGFVVYGVAATLVLPIRGTPTTLPGLWVLDDEGGAPPAVRGLATPEACECPSACGEPSPGAPKTLLEPMPDSGRSGTDDCGWSIREPWALFGGTLELAGEDYNGCGINLYGFGSSHVALVRTPKSLTPSTRAGVRWCEVDSTPATAIWPPGTLECREHKGAWIPADMDEEALRDSQDPELQDEGDDEPAPCTACTRESWDSELHFVRRGLLITIRDDVQATSIGTREVAYVKATPERCLSAADPCGSTSAFSAVPGVKVPEIPKVLGKAPPDVDSGPDFWIASDGSHALTWSAMAWALWRPGQNTSTQSGVAAALFDNVIGVRYHSDITPLLRGGCSALCSEPSQCPEVVNDAGEGDDDENDDSQGDDSESDDSEGDEDDTRSASELGNACFKALKAGDLDDAEELCTRALSKSPAPRTLGAVLYNLGLIAERRGDDATARKHYEASLKARPNETVQKRLRALE